MENNGIVSDNVYVTFDGKKNTLNGVSFNVEPGKAVYLAGRNGAGKTTWIRAAVQLIPIKSGKITYDGRPFNEVRDSFAIVLDSPAFYLNMSARDNLRVVYGISYKDIDKASEFLDALHLQNDLNQKVYRYSFGKRHRLAVAGALLRKPKYLILDEPDTGLDAESLDFLSTEFTSLKKIEGTAILLTGQGYEILSKITDSFVYLEGNSIVYNGNVDGFLEREKISDIRSAMLNRMKVKV